MTSTSKVLAALGLACLLVGLWTCSESFSFKFSMTGMSVLALACFYDAFQPRSKG